MHSASGPQSPFAEQVSSAQFPAAGSGTSWVHGTSSARSIRPWNRSVVQQYWKPDGVPSSRSMGSQVDSGPVDPECPVVDNVVEGTVPEHPIANQNIDSAYAGPDRTVPRNSGASTGRS